MAKTLLDRVTFPWVVWVLLLLLPITFLGFYSSYFALLGEPLPPIIHIHGIMMLLWLFIAIIQPFLVKYNKIGYHKKLGRLSYVLMPLIIVSGYFILQYSYQRALSGDEVGPPGHYPEELPLNIKAAEFVVIGSVYLIWLTIYYLLGVYFRKNTVAHAAFMIAAAFTILGPSGDRFIGYVYDTLGWNYNWFAENLTFIFVFIFFIALSINHTSKKISLKPVLMVLSIHATGVLLFYLLPYSSIWNWLTARVF
jgi:hypothetical protein